MHSPPWHEGRGLKDSILPRRPFAVAVVLTNLSGSRQAVIFGAWEERTAHERLRFGLAQLALSRRQHRTRQRLCLAAWNHRTRMATDVAQVSAGVIMAPREACSAHCQHQ